MVTEWIDTDVYFNSLSEEEMLEANLLLWNGIKDVEL